MTTDPDPFEQGERAARENIPAEGNPYQEGSEQYALWASGHERVAAAIASSESQATLTPSDGAAAASRDDDCRSYKVRGVATEAYILRR